MTLFSLFTSASEMTYIVSGGALNSTHSLSVSIHSYRRHFGGMLRVYSGSVGFVNLRMLANFCVCGIVQ